MIATRSITNWDRFCPGRSNWPVVSAAQCSSCSVSSAMMASPRPVAGRQWTRSSEAANFAAEAGVTVVIENEPNFWVDRPVDTAKLLNEIGHPDLMPTGTLPIRTGAVTCRRTRISGPEATHRQRTYQGLLSSRSRSALATHRAGGNPWREMLRWVVTETDLTHATLETHCVPLAESSKDEPRQSASDA
jgi:hypothetical protein